MKKLGLGIQELSVFKEKNLIYVDKTELIHIIDYLDSIGISIFLTGYTG
ncbi:MAG: hypothetical protein KAI50_09225 [Desulfobacterales bacterium]|nr:hypothetical protein [Desulfobacterales bacterium]